MILFLLVTLVVAVVLVGGGVWAAHEFDNPIPAIIGTVVWIGLTVLFGWLAFGTEQTDTFTVEGKERIAEGDDGKWMVYATDGQTYENTDAWYHGKTDSTDLYRAIEVGKTYRCEVNGVRFSLLSMYKNLLDCEEVSS